MRYPRLFREYTYLSEREKGADLCDILGDYHSPKIDQATGLCTTIMMVDFTNALPALPDECPMKTESDANKFFQFLFNCLTASESGSIGGDACRQFDVLNAALYDAISQTSTVATFEHLLGWTGE